MGAKFLTAEKTTAPAIMGCYGIGVGRLMASVVENSHDDFGPIWPKSIAPFQVEIVPIGKEAELMELAEKFEKELEAAGIDVLVDDRDERPGVKFKDADLWGSPVRIAIGKKGLVNGEVEWKFRNEKQFTMVKVEDVIAKAKEYFAE
jgi:prolyl-tRNA synthetase